MLIPIAFLITLIQNISNQKIAHTPLSNIALFLFGCITIGWIVQVILEIRKKIRLDHQREAAARGKIQRQVQEQPQPDPNALSLPVQIQHLSSNRLWLPWLYFCTAFIVVFELIFIINMLQPSDRFRDLHIQMSIILPICLLMLWGGTFLYRSYQWLEVTDERLTFRTLVSKKTIYWKEARLFAVHTAIPSAFTFSFTRESDDVFELSSAKRIIHWTWIQNTTPVLIKEKTSFEIYQQQMRGLLQVITAKTRLPLYDLKTESRRIFSLAQWTIFMLYFKL